jgi:hypothetical protein
MACRVPLVLLLVASLAALAAADASSAFEYQFLDEGLAVESNQDLLMTIASELSDLDSQVRSSRSFARTRPVPLFGMHSCTPAP